jgi:hypothetical protein
MPELLSRQLRNDRKCKSIDDAPESVIDCHAHAKQCRDLANYGKVSEAQRESSLAITVVSEREIPQCPQGYFTIDVASPQTNARVATERDSTADAVSAFNTENEETAFNIEPEYQIQSIRTLVQCLLLRQHHIRRGSPRDASRVDFVEALKKWDHFVAVGGCFTVMIRRLSKESV